MIKRSTEFLRDFLTCVKDRYIRTWVYIADNGFLRSNQLIVLSTLLEFSCLFFSNRPPARVKNYHGIACFT